MLGTPFARIATGGTLGAALGAAGLWYQLFRRPLPRTSGRLRLAGLEAPVDVLQRRFDEHEAEAEHLLDKGLPLPAYDQVLKSSHTFNLLDARGAVSVTERAAYIGRIRNLARSVAQSYFESRERLGFPMAPREWVEQMNKKAPVSKTEGPVPSPVEGAV